MELARSTSRGGFSVRSIITFVLTVLVTALLGTTLFSTVAKAAPEADWIGDSIQYDSHQYFRNPDAKAGESHGLPPGTQMYIFIEDIDGTPKQQKAHVIYFAPGADPPNATSAEYISYDYSPGRVYSNPQGKKAISINPQGTSGSYRSCSVDGVGWIVCPISVFLADTMDWFFGILSDLIAVQPLKTADTTSDLYIAWNVMRSIANVAFIIVFLIIIYSQLTNVGIDNYGLKKLIPRLIIAAVLVNVSYYICAIAVDLSNIAGYSLQDILKGIRDNTFNIDAEWTDQAIRWPEVVAFVLSGGAAGALGIAVSTAGSAVSAIYLILPILLGLILTALFVVLVLAARQALIIILIILAPLAFVAYLLPNTEKWFEKWREIFMTMLIFFPAFSLVFGGSQLAGGIILQNATSIVMVVLGLAVQVAPLVITPLILKFSGGVLGKVAGMINDPRKGLMDRARNWSNDRAEMHRQKSLTKPGMRNPFRSVARRLDNGNRAVKERTALYTAMNDNRYNRTRTHERLYGQMHETETDKKIIEGTLERDLKNRMYTSPHMLAHEMESRTVADEVSLAGERLNRIHEGLRTGEDISVTGNLGHLTARTSNVTRDLAATAISIQTAKRVQQNQLSRALLENNVQIDGLDIRTWSGARLDVVRDAAGNITQDNGSDSALTYAVNLKREAEAKLISERTQLIKHFKLNGAQRQEIARGNNVNAQRDGATYTFTAADEFTREAAIEMQMTTGSYDEIAEIVAMSGSGAFDFRSTISEMIPKNGLTSKALFFGGKFIDNVGQGNVAAVWDAAQDRWVPDPAAQGPDAHDLVWWAAQSILEGKIKAEDLANNEQGALKVYSQAAADAVNRGYIQPHQMQTWLDRVNEFRSTAALILSPDTDLDRNATQAAKERLQDIVDGVYRP